MPALPHPPAAVNQLCPRIAGAESGADPARIERRRFMDSRIHGFMDSWGTAAAINGSRAGDPLGLLPAGAWYRGKIPAPLGSRVRGKSGASLGLWAFCPAGFADPRESGEFPRKRVSTGARARGCDKWFSARADFFCTTFLNSTRNPKSRNLYPPPQGTIVTPPARTR